MGRIVSVAHMPRHLDREEPRSTGAARTLNRGSCSRRRQATALLCHGPIAAVSAMLHAREFRAALIAGATDKAMAWAKDWPYAGYRMTVFSATEETVVEEHILHAKMYFDMPSALTAAGGKVITSDVDFEPNVVEDRELITGQNPRSDQPLAATFIAALNRSATV